MSTASYPKIPESNWWRLRDQFKKTLPNAVTTAYLRSLLSLNSEGAAQNLIGPLRQVALIDEGGKPTDRANDWRNDAKYPEVCAAIIAEVYPQELRDLYSGPDLDRAGVENWFMHGAALGQAAAARNAQFYALLNQGVPQSSEAPAKKSEKKAKSPTKQSQSKKSETKERQEPVQQQRDTGVQDRKQAQGPTVHMDFQIHISPEADAAQIEAIFAAMAKHLYGK